MRQTKAGCPSFKKTFEMGLSGERGSCRPSTYWVPSSAHMLSVILIQPHLTEEQVRPREAKPLVRGHSALSRQGCNMQLN